jgi:hypothetical protein
VAAGQQEEEYWEGNDGSGGYYDDNGEWVEASGYYDENGYWIETGGYYDDNGAWIEYAGYYDDNGEWVEVENAQQQQQIQEQGSISRISISTAKLSDKTLDSFSLKSLSEYYEQ